MVNPLTTYTIAPGVTYCIVPYHRDGTPGKSQWEINNHQERDVFTEVHRRNWIQQNKGWGLHLVGGVVSYLGRTRDHRRLVFIAKFVDEDHTQTWHGYPADHQSSASDIPVPAILKQWMDANLLRRAVLRKIAKGQPCSL